MVTCWLCKEICQSVHALKIHYKIAHVKDSAQSYKCGDGCANSYDNWNSLQKHITRKHKNLDHNSCDRPPKLPKISEGVVPTTFSNEVSGSENILLQNQNSDAPLITAAQFKEGLFRNAEIFVAKLYEKPNLPRNIVQLVIDQTAEFLCSGFVDILETEVVTKLEGNGCDSAFVADLKSMFAALKDPFKGLMTEYKRVQHFEACKYYVAPETYTISENRLKIFHTKEGPVTKFVKTTGQFVPLRKVLKNLFELPGSLSETLAYVDILKDQSNSNFVTNLIQCSVWQRKISKFAPTDIVIPLNFYFDEFEPNAALGGHSEKLGGGYVQMPVLPPSCQSKLENILLALIFDADDRKSIEVGKISYNEECFKPVIEEFNFLESEGILCVTPDKGPVRLYFVLCLVLGDNLGMSGVHGFAECPTCNKPCRLCKASKEQVKTMIVQDASLFRQLEDYNHDLALDDVSLTGLKEASVFNDVSSFHVTKDLATDVMHDAAEGVCHYVIIPVLKHFLDSQYFDMDTLNSRLALFDYGPSDKDNKPPCISEDFHRKDKLKFTAKEMIQFIRFLGVLIGDLVPKNDKYWELYKLTRQIMQIYQAKALPKTINEELDFLIKEHHALYLKLTGKNLTLKFHNYTHSSEVFERFGPFSHYAAMRGEAKHKQLKGYCSNITSRVNLPKSVAIKHQLMMTYRFASNLPLLSKDLVCGPSEIFDVEDHVKYAQFSKCLPKSISFGTAVEWLDWIDFHGTQYERNMVVVLGVQAEDALYRFGKIVEIIVTKMRPLFICQVLHNIGFDEHICGFEVKKSDTFVSVHPSELLDYDPLYDFVTCEGENFVVLKHYI